MDKKVINNIRSLSIDMINEAGSGHPGICLGASPIIYTLFANHLNFNKDDTSWINRDRFVLSAGHGSAMLYSTLSLAGYPISIEDMKSFRKHNAALEGHPVLNKKFGVEMTTGSLGEGFASSVGIAIAEEYLSTVLGKNIINYYTYVLVSDGDLMEGISYEAASLAGKLNLKKLIVLYDSNKMTLDGVVDLSTKEDIIKRFEACGWNTEIVLDGENTDLIDKAIINAKNANKPTLIEIKTIIGKGSRYQNTNIVHGRSLDENDYLQLKEKLGFKIPFHISKDSTIYFRNKIENRIVPIYNEWIRNYNEICKDEDKKKIINSLETNEYSINLKKVKIQLDKNEKEELRISSGKLMNLLSELMPLMMSLSADVFSSTKTFLENGKIFKDLDRSGKNIYVGVRENLLAAIMNGLAVSNLRPVGSAFLAFSDNMKSGMRLSSLMNLPVTYIFTHDSAVTNKDGIVHCPIEQLGNLRSIPGMITFRPADIKEIVGCWDYIINNKKPTNLVLANQSIPILENTDISKVEKGAYIVKKEISRLSGIIMASGSEVYTALKISDDLYKKGIWLRVISVPSLELFNQTSEEYKKEIIPVGSKVIVIEASNDKSWYEYVYNKKYVLNIENYESDFNYSELLEKVEMLIK